MELIVAVFLTLVVISWISRPTQQTKRIPRKPKYKQYDEDRYADYFMKKVSEVYNIKERPEEQSEDDEEEKDGYNNTDEETESDIEFEKKSDLSPAWLNQQTQYDSYEMEDMEIRSKFFEGISKILELIGILWLFGIIVTETYFPNMESFLASKTIIPLLAKIAPVLFWIFAMVTRILGVRNKSLGDRALTIIRGIFMILLGLGYVFSQLSDFLSNSN